MPIIIKDFKWRQTINTIIIQVPLRGIHQSKVEIFTCPRYIRASYSPYFFEIFPLEPVDRDKSRCTLTETEITFELFKETPREWENLELDLPKSEKNQLKTRLIEEEHSRFAKECEDKLMKKSQLKKTAVREQICLETQQRETIESIKNNEKVKALGDLKEWKEDLISPSPKIVELDSSDDEGNQSQVAPAKVEVKRQKSLANLPKIKYNLKKCNIKDSVPLPRQNTTVTVEFTNRELPTPSRESRLEEEQEWLRKQSEVRRSAGFLSEDLRPEEKNPVYLLAKGDEFMKNNNYLGAISAYSFGIKLSEKYPDLYRKRGEAHYAVGNMQRCIEDCSQALDLMKPAVSANFLERIECIIRRGKALFQFGFREQGFREIEVAYKMQPDNDELKELLTRFMDELNNAKNKSDDN
ncbi:dynein assembly factor 4 axonemal [Holotrichia oblita]|uniref:Dynein assembly factor 4 axonemal n=1 Tax=Holotrichia oblita TaxID=644536 RepID=A0ACB9TXY9_HOLOL|nr:dynein assembly factor 4 axonemal [Holotrichia oblita]